MNMYNVTCLHAPIRVLPYDISVKRQ